MNLLKSFFVWAALLMVLYATEQVIDADGWLAGGVFLLVLTVFFGLVVGVADMLLAPFRNRRPG
ncbi:MAG: hypothetical protein AMXMBFR6_08380 [Betaproteobacteria bacterium]|nr:hypothetical protein [Rhodocyclaceae bacterium]MCG3186532.1 hypothetical protein [Rhodocyclaceae bacterium]